jgi:hypothetical protein
MNNEAAGKRMDELLPLLMEKGSLTPDQQKELDELLQVSEEIRAYYDSYIDTHIALDWHFAGNSLGLPSGLESEIDQTKPQDPVKFPLWALLALAALFAIGFFIDSAYFAKKPSYKFSNSVSAIWSEGKSYEIGESPEKNKLALVSGYTELETQTGVKLILEGPAELELLSNEKVILTKGTLVTYIPDPKVTFTVQTPKADITDTGTELALTVEENGDTELHALGGQVEFSLDGKKSLLENSQAQIMTAKQSVLAKADAGRFMRILPKKPQDKISFINWSFNEGQGEEAAQQSKNLADKNYNGYFRSTYENGNKPQWVNGKFGKALDFDGTGGYLETEYPGIGGTQARTVSFWVKIPQDAIKDHAISMVAWGSYEGKGKTWQISWNWREKDGVVGALRAGLYHGQIVGSKDLRDGQWHHVAVVLFGGKRANISTHILLYVDGQLEQASRKSILDVKTDVESKNAIKVLMGRDAMAYLQKTKKHKVFNGAMDEVYIFNCALDESQIRSLMNYNKSGLE